MKGLHQYEPKILIAFTEAVGLNHKIHQWLLENGFPELAALASSIQCDIDAFNWLLKNGYPHFAAFSNAIDEDKAAYQWLVDHEFTLLAIITDAAYLNPEALGYLRTHRLEIFTRMALEIRKLKESQHKDYDFYYKMRF